MVVDEGQDRCGSDRLHAGKGMRWMRHFRTSDDVNTFVRTRRPWQQQQDDRQRRRRTA